MKNKLYPIIFILSSIYSLVMVSLGANLSEGAASDFYTYHYPTVLVFKDFPLQYALLEMNSASGPIFYAVATLFNSEFSVRAFSGSVYFLTAIFIVANTKNLFKTPDKKNVMLASAFLISPFTISTASWANPEIFALCVTGFSNLILKKHEKIGSFFNAISVLARQTFITISFYKYSVLFFQTRNVKYLFLFFVPLFSLIILVFYWKGLTPPKFGHHNSISPRAFLISIGCFSIYFLPFVALNFKELKDYYIKNLQAIFFIAIPVFILWNISLPLDKGGFIFGRFQEYRYLNPAIITFLIFLIIPLAKENALLFYGMLLVSLTLSASSILYLKYVDIFFFALLFSCGFEKISLRLFKSFLITEVCLNILIWIKLGFNVFYLS